METHIEFHNLWLREFVKTFYWVCRSH